MNLFAAHGLILQRGTVDAAFGQALACQRLLRFLGPALSTLLGHVSTVEPVNLSLPKLSEQPRHVILLEGLNEYNGVMEHLKTKLRHVHEPMRVII